MMNKSFNAPNVTLGFNDGQVAPMRDNVMLQHTGWTCKVNNYAAHVESA